MSKTRVVVTGAAGFMGSYVMESLIARGDCEVWAIDDLSGGYRSNVPEGAHFEQLDLRDKEKTSQFFARVKPTLLYHLAADASE